MLNNRKNIIKLSNHIEELWKSIDNIFSSFDESDWEKSHGGDWKFSDIPYHFYYYDNFIIANSLVYGDKLSEDLRLEFVTAKELNEWNTQMFSQRPATQSVAESLKQMNSARERIRNLLSTMTDDDLDSKAWYPNLMFRGWRTKERIIRIIYAHTFDHILEMREILNTNFFRPSPETVHASMKSFAEIIFSGFIHGNRHLLQEKEITLVSEFTGPGGGVWTHRCKGDDIKVTQQREENADITVSMSPETFIRIGKGIQETSDAIEEGSMIVEGIEHLPTYGSILAFPAENQITEIYK